MSVRTTLFVGATVVVMAVGVNQTLLPDDPVQQRHQEQVEQLSDSNENVKEGHRDAGNEHGDAELGQKNVPGEHRPPEPKGPKLPEIRIRFP